MAKKKPFETPICREVQLPEESRLAAALDAIRAFPPNAPAGAHDQKDLAVFTSKYWGQSGAELTVGFMERPKQAIIDKVLAYANRWNTVAHANLKFRWTQTSPQIRVSFGPGGYWSYIGRDCLQIPQGQQTMNLEGFDNPNMPESEWLRVPPHEFGHAAGCPHEHQRQEIIDLLDPAKTTAYFMRTQGWSAQQVRQQVLTPLEESSIMGTPHADQMSLLCYQFPGSITKSGQPIPGGADFSPEDIAFIEKIYPPPVVQPPTPPTPTPAGSDIIIRIKNAESITVDGYIVSKVS